MQAPLVVPVVMILLAIPLILGRVPPNGLYGFRTPKTLSSRHIWYPANRRSGIYLALAGVVILLAYAGFRLSGGDPEQSKPVMLVMILGPVTAALAASFAYLRKL